MSEPRESAELSPADADGVRELAAAAAARDGVAPYGEQTLIALTRPGVHLLVRDAGRLAGYAQLDPGTPAAEVAVHPAYRRRGTGTALVQALVRRAPGVRIWAHGSLPAAAALAARLGLQTSRELLQLELTDLGALPPVGLPDGIALRSFLPGLDDAEWLELNARAFVDLPDQGGWTARDLTDRQSQAWFDPAGFLIAVDGAGDMVGFHWTKVEERPRPGGGHDHVGEVYVVGVDPDRQGLGLGRALTLAGLHHLRGVGVQAVTLYVDGANTAARALYDSLGFTRHHTDTEYQHVPS